MERMKNFLTHSTSKNVFINTAGNYIGVIFAFFYTLFLARYLPVAEFGTLSVLLSIAYVLANILDFGVTAAIYAYLPDLLPDKSKAVGFIKSNFFLLTTLASITLIILFKLTDILDRSFLKLEVGSSYYFWTLLSVLFFIWQNFLLNILYASKKFLYANIAANISHASKLILLLILMWSDKISIPIIIVILGIAGPVVFMLVVSIETKAHIVTLFKSNIDRAHIKLSYSLQYFIATQMFNVASRADLFLVSYFLSKESVGQYALAQRIVLAVITSVNSITQVLSPQFAGATDRGEVIKLLRRGVIYMMAPAVLFVGVLLTPDFIYSLFFTEKFITAAPITRALSSVYILYGFSILPLLYFLYTIKRPRYLLFANSAFLIIVAAGCYILIPKYGLFGPPMAFGAAFVVITFFAITTFIKNIDEDFRE